MSQTNAYQAESHNPPTIEARLHEIAAAGCGIVTDDAGNGCAGPAYLNAETLSDMLGSGAFSDAKIEAICETGRAQYAFESLEMADQFAGTDWIQVSLRSNSQGWSQVGWIWND